MAVQGKTYRFIHSKGQTDYITAVDIGSSGFPVWDPKKNKSTTT
jgi:hypothetical protein